MVRPSLWRRRKSQICRRANGSTPAVGSSRMIVRDSPTKATRMDSFLFIPPERWTASLSTWDKRPSLESQLGWEEEEDEEGEDEEGEDEEGEEEEDEEGEDCFLCMVYTKGNTDYEVGM